jgi:hypothetical protein
MIIRIMSPQIERINFTIEIFPKYFEANSLFFATSLIVNVFNPKSGMIAKKQVKARANEYLPNAIS